MTAPNDIPHFNFIIPTSFTSSQLAQIEYNRLLALDLIGHVFRDRAEREEFEALIILEHKPKKGVTHDRKTR